MANKAQNRSQPMDVPGRKVATSRGPVKRNSINNAEFNGTPEKNVNAKITKKAAPATKETASIAGESPVQGVTSAYAIMASRIANRVAEMAESITFVERPKPQESQPVGLAEKKRPRKLEMRLQQSSPDEIAFSAPFLDNTLQKMLALQNRMLRSTAELSKAEGVGAKLVKEHAAHSAELSRIIALICAEKARQGT